jgi:hypothetical protein
MLNLDTHILLHAKCWCPFPLTFLRKQIARAPRAAIQSGDTLSAKFTEVVLGPELELATARCQFEKNNFIRPNPQIARLAILTASSQNLRMQGA